MDRKMIDDIRRGGSVRYPDPDDRVKRIKLDSRTTIVPKPRLGLSLPGEQPQTKTCPCCGGIRKEAQDG